MHSKTRTNAYPYYVALIDRYMTGDEAAEFVRDLEWFKRAMQANSSRLLMIQDEEAKEEVIESCAERMRSLCAGGLLHRSIMPGLQFSYLTVRKAMLDGTPPLKDIAGKHESLTEEVYARLTKEAPLWRKEARSRIRNYEKIVKAFDDAHVARHQASMDQFFLFEYIAAEAMNQLDDDQDEWFIKMTTKPNLALVDEIASRLGV